MFMSPRAEQAVLGEVEERFRRFADLQAQAEADPDMGRRLAEHSRSYARLARPGVVTGMALAGLEADSPQSRALVEYAAQRRLAQEGVRPQVGETVNSSTLGALAKTFTRGMFTGLSAPFQEVSRLAVAAGDAALTDDSFGEALGDTAPSALRLAWRSYQENDVPWRGSEEHLGTGFLPGGEVERERREIEQANLGPDGQHLTPGRLVPMGLNQAFGRTVVEPGTRPYNLVSGLADFAANIAVDPLTYVGGGFAKAGKAVRTFGVGPEDIGVWGRAMAQSGLVPGARRGAIGESVVEFLQRQQGQAVVERIAAIDSPSVIFRGFGGKIEPEAAARLADATDGREVEQVLRGVLGSSIRAKPTARGFREQTLSTRSYGVGPAAPDTSFRPAQTVAPAPPAGPGLPPLFHGTARAIPNDTLVPGQSAIDGMYGPGFYTTESRDIAGSYLGKGSGGDGVTYSVRWTGQGVPRVLDVEEVASAQVRAAVRRFMDSADVPADRLHQLHEVLDDSTATIDRIYQASTYPLQSAVGSARATLMRDFNRTFGDLGYDALRYTEEGFRGAAGGARGSAFVFLDESKVALERVADASAPAMRNIAPADNAFLEATTGGFTDRLPRSRRSLHGIRMAQEMPNQILDLNDMRSATGNFDAYLRNAKLPDEVVRGFTDDLLRVDPLDVEEVNGIVTRANQRIMDELIGVRGTAPEKARRLTSVMAGQWAEYARDARQYLMNRVGQPILPPGRRAFWEVNGEQIPLDGGVAAMLVHARSDAVFLPDVRALRREASWMRGLWDTPVVGKMAGGAVDLLGSFTQKFWKPLQLIRPAIMLRVLPEEQARMAAHGDVSLFTHPAQYFAYVTGRRGAIDAAGNPVAEAGEYLSAISTRFTDFVRGEPIPRSVYTGDFVKGYKGQAGDTGWWAGYLGRFSADPIASEVAATMAGVSGRSWDEMRHAMRDGDLAELVERAARQLNLPKLRSPEGLDDYLENTLRASLTDATGGDYARGVNGDAELLAAIARGRFGDAPVVPRGFDGVPGSGDVVPFGDARVTSWLDERRDFMPPVMPRPRTGGETAAGGPLSRMVNRGFEAFMSRPTDRFSRSPTYRSAMWGEIERLLPYATREVQQVVLDNAAKANLGRDALRRMRARAGRGAEGQLSSVAHVDRLAHAVALDTTRSLLYDISKRSQFSDVLRVVAPFAEPWKEILTTWTRLVGENPVTLRRAQQTIEGARGADFDGDGQGFFYQDPSTGEEMFAYPGGHLLTRLLGRDVGQIRLTGRVEGLNLVGGSLLPGFGPAISMAAARLIPERPELEGLRDFLFPFGEPEVDTPGAALDSLLPAYLRRAVTALRADPNADRVFGNTVIDVMKSLAASGEYGTDEFGMLTRDAQLELEADALSFAKRLYWLRAVAQSTLPTGPQPEFRTDTPEGVMTFHALAAEYRSMMDDAEAGGSETAMERFVERFGFAPTLVTQAKSQQVRYRPLEEMGAAWERRHPEFVKRFRNVAGYFAPSDPDGLFDSRAYEASLEMGDRVTLTPEEALLVHNNTLGRLAMEQAKRSLGEGADTAEGRAMLATIRANLREEYPGFQSTVGIPRGADVDTLVNEVRAALADPVLRDHPAAPALRAYLADRETALDAARQIDGRIRGFGQAAAAAPIRVWLRERADTLIRQHPEFAPFWDRIFSRELADDAAAMEAAA